MATFGDDLDQLSSSDLGELARDAMSLLARRGDPEAFSQLVTMSAHAGQCLGEGARRLASAASWTQVADLTGVSKQAAWSRWRL
ncbi:MAG: hypothetical protein ACXVEU_10730 [Nocardioidaceae bacterium]